MAMTCCTMRDWKASVEFTKTTPTMVSGDANPLSLLLLGALLAALTSALETARQLAAIPTVERLLHAVDERPRSHGGTPVETAEALPGSAIILIADTRARMAAHQVEVVARGADAACDDDDCERVHVSADGVLRHACPAQPGDWVLMRPRTAIEGPTPERAEWFLAQDDVLAILREEDGNAEALA